MVGRVFCASSGVHEKSSFHWLSEVSTVQLPEVINISLLPIISIHYPVNRLMRILQPIR